jgi:glycosyltransferase involved in cell wall biosynthesis
VNDPLISVIICVHNAERHLAETLDSVTRQAGVRQQDQSKGIEVILIDDLSTDRSLDIINHYVPILNQRGFSARTVCHTENKHIIKSYNEGVELAKGKYFKILDHDDILASDDALSQAVEFMETMESQGFSIGAVFSKTLYMDEESRVFGEKRFPFPFLPYEARTGLIPRRWGEFVIAFSPIYPFVHGSSVVRKTCYENLSVGEVRRRGSGLFDVLFAIHVMHSREWRVGYLQAPGLQYRIHSTSYTHSMVSRQLWSEILISHYKRIYGTGPAFVVISMWTKLVQGFKSLYHRVKGGTAFKSIGLFGRRTAKR